MPALDRLFTDIENKEITLMGLAVGKASHILMSSKVRPLSLFLLSQWSKIGKVMRHLGNLHEDQVPRDEEFMFRQRALALVDKWMRQVPRDGDFVHGIQSDDHSGLETPEHYVS
jgi:hypothetical protein